MGQEIDRIQFSGEDFTRFSRQLREETRLLESLMAAGRFSECLPCVAGVEIEGWLLDRHYFPVADNQRFLALLGDPLVVPELSRFNIEMNCQPRVLAQDVLSLLSGDLNALWQRCFSTAHACEHTLLLIGILPTLRESDLSMTNVSPLNRYYALNDQVMRSRGGEPVRLDIKGRDHLQLEHGDVMLEAGATSFQLHLQMPFAQSVRFYNAAQWLAAPMVAVAANSPYLFGHDLWAETRIPLFEQSVDSLASASDSARVTFGHGWLQASPFEIFHDNLTRFAPLLPLPCSPDPACFSHVRLHNGTVWRWNRLLLGENTDGTPHVRLEHRVMPAGPTFIDMMANAALFYGAAYALAHLEKPVEQRLDFSVVRDDFYRAAQEGLAVHLHALDGTVKSLQTLVLEELLPLAASGLQAQGVDVTDSERLLGIIRRRVECGQNGAVWQRRYIARNPGDFIGLTARYLEHQRQGSPVHEWGLD
jgi:hypothetical protein